MKYYWIGLVDNLIQIYIWYVFVNNMSNLCAP